VNLEQLVRDALAEEGRGEPDQTSAYDRFRRRRIRYLGRMGVAVALAVAVGLAVPQLLPSRHEVTSRPRPVPGGAIVRVPDQGYELQVPAGWQVDAQRTQRNRQLGQDWLVLRPVEPARTAAITAYTDTLDPGQHPDRPRSRDGLGFDQPGGLGFTRLAGRISHARRADGRRFVVAKQDRHWQYAIAWPFHCPKGVRCPAEARLRALLINVDAPDRASWPNASAAAAWIVTTVRPIGNAVTAQPTATGLSGLPVSPTIRIASGGHGRGAWTLDANQRTGPNGGVGMLLRFPNDPSGMREDPSLKRLDPSLGARDGAFDGRLYTQGECLDRWPDPDTGPHARIALLWGATAKQAHSVRIDLAGAPAVEVTVVGQDKPLPYNFFVSPPLPPSAHVRQVEALDAGGQALGRAAWWDRYRTLCVKPGSAIWR
jgi:hypothetical protein